MANKMTQKMFGYKKGELEVGFWGWGPQSQALGVEKRSFVLRTWQVLFA